MMTPQTVRTAKTRQKRKVLDSAARHGFTVLPDVDLLMRDDKGVLWSWTFDNDTSSGKWTRLVAA